MSSVYVEVLLFHLNDGRPELASIKVNVTELSLDLVHVFHFSNPRSVTEGSLCLSEGAGSTSFVAEQKLPVNTGSSGEMLFSLSELISLLLTHPAG